MTTSVEEQWRRIESWFKQNEPAFLASLGAGASNTAINELQSAIGLNLPEDYKAFLAIHDGEGSLSCDPGSIEAKQEDEVPLVCGIMPFHGDLLPTEEIVAYRNQLIVCVEDLEDDQALQQLAEQCPEVQPVFYDSNWIPIAADPGLYEVFIDLNPTSTGKPGQVFIDSKEPLCRELLASSFNDLLKKYADGLEQGIYQIVKEDDILSVVKKHK
ncbi:SMI1/KNR4 family protein [Spartinivicinus poritis]|uniref:SMI1/KNR4 family protein n=1 Tax=Spartinivicinus poritis TaxID=2994640 RepID=A0ABT5UFF8_9GAMM|nr:SMI1/KNR4 family protein [Spartinivicinus sp. A2-2]MDE1465115.1 SMI1/KNR4 family protein [Spartinivicinus sp. A2-2]